MTIENVAVNNKKKSIEIDTAKGRFSLPFSKLRLAPAEGNSIKRAYVDEELGNEAVTYVLNNGQEDSIHLDSFLDYNRDPEYMARVTLYKLTLKAIELVKKSGISKREITRKLKTSPTQLYRLLDTTNYSKTLDQMIKLLTALGYKVDFVLNEDSPVKETTEVLTMKFPHLSENDLKSIPQHTDFKPLLSGHKLAA